MANSHHGSCKILLPLGENIRKVDCHDVKVWNWTRALHRSPAGVNKCQKFPRRLNNFSMCQSLSETNIPLFVCMYMYVYMQRLFIWAAAPPHKCVCYYIRKCYIMLSTTHIFLQQIISETNENHLCWSVCVHVVKQWLCNHC